MREARRRAGTEPPSNRMRFRETGATHIESSPLLGSARRHENGLVQPTCHGAKAQRIASAAMRETARKSPITIVSDKTVEIRGLDEQNCSITARFWQRFQPNQCRHFGYSLRRHETKSTSAPLAASDGIV